MKYLLALALVLLCAASGFAEQDVIHPPLQIQDEGTPLGRPRVLNFTGTAITCTGSSTVTCNVTGGSGTFTIKEVEIDWAVCGIGLVGGRASYDCRIGVADNDVVPATAKVILTHSGRPATGKSEDENEMDSLLCRAAPRLFGGVQPGFLLFCRSTSGMATGTYLINYTVAN